MSKSTKTPKTTKEKRRGNILLPADDNIAAIAALLTERFKKEKLENRYAPIRHVLSLVGIVGAVTFALAAPKAAPLIKSLLDKPGFDPQLWKQYNRSYLRRAIKRLRQQKLVEVEEHDDYQTVTLTKEGKRRVLRYALDELRVRKPPRWDGKWRLVIYDVPNKKVLWRNLFRQTLRRLGFLLLQESVWLYPYPCEKEVTFLREYFDVGGEVLYVRADHIEGDQPYREYFGLD